MYKKKMVLTAILSLMPLMFLPFPVYSAYGTISKVDIDAPSWAGIGQPIQVGATVYTSITG